MSVHHLTKLLYSNDTTGPWKLYVFEKNSAYHRCGVWFMEKPEYPEEGEITIAVAAERVDDAMADGREVRICDGGDMLVFHARGSTILHGAAFLTDVLRTPSARSGRAAAATPPPRTSTGGLNGAA